MRRLLRPAALLTTLGLVAAGAVTLAPAAAAATTPDTTKLAAYLTGQLTGGNRYESFDFPDIGLTIDGALALAASGSATDVATVGRIADYLDSKVGRNWVEFDGDPANFDGGSAGKMALLAEVAHRDPRAFAQLDLVQELSDSVCTAAQVTATPDNCSGVGNYRHASSSSSTFSQALGVIAQQRVGTANPTAVTFLLSLQKADGAFVSLVPNSGDSDPDSTAMAIQALALLPDASDPSSAVATALTNATAYLAGSQNADGSWGPSFNRTSTNSTALVVQAFSVNATVRAAQSGEITKALAFLGGLQNADGGLPVNADATQNSSDIRASTQVLGGVVGVPFGTLSTPVAVSRTATTDPAAAAGARWLVGQLVTGDHLERGGYVDQSTTGDLAYALLASGGQDAALGRVLAYLSLDTTLRSYVGGANFGDRADSVYVGATAKFATLLQLAGQDPTDVGVDHVDLIADLVGQQQADGRFADRSDFGNYANVLGLSFGVLALTAAGDTAAAAKARTALVATQCPDGGFPVYFDAPTCAPTADATGLAIQALDAGKGTATAQVTPAVAPAELTAALGWLTANQAADGSYAGNPGVTNSTAYAALGLLAVGQNATKPRAFLTSVATRAGGDGGLPVDATGTSDTLATAQAVPALAGLSFLQLTPSVLTRVDTIVGTDPVPTTPPTTPPTTTPPTTPPGSGAPTTGPTGAGSGGASGQGGGTSLGDGSLADTGADVLAPLWLAAFAIVLGAAATVYGVRRPRRATHAARSH